VRGSPIWDPAESSSSSSSLKPVVRSLVAGGLCLCGALLTIAIQSGLLMGSFRYVVPFVYAAAIAIVISNRKVKAAAPSARAAEAPKADGNVFHSWPVAV
jgi:Mg2+/citrate symporter